MYTSAGLLGRTSFAAEGERLLSPEYGFYPR